RGRVAACHDLRGQRRPPQRVRLEHDPEKCAAVFLATNASRLRGDHAQSGIAMRENLHRFFRAARGAGVHVSPAESIDAMRAVASVGFEERGILRDTLLLTLAKSEDEKKALGACFDLFFSQPEPAQPSDAKQSDDESASASQSQSAQSAGGGAQPQNLGPLAQMLLAQDPSEIAAAIAN